MTNRPNTIIGQQLIWGEDEGTRDAVGDQRMHLAKTLGRLMGDSFARGLSEQFIPEIINQLPPGEHWRIVLRAKLEAVPFDEPIPEFIVPPEAGVATR